MSDELTALQIEVRVHAHWNLGRGPYIRPRSLAIRCPICQTPKHLHVQSWTFFASPDPESRMPYRIDVVIKCQMCSAIWLHGVPVSELFFDKNVTPVHDVSDGPVRVNWRDV